MQSQFMKPEAYYHFKKGFIIMAKVKVKTKPKQKEQVIQTPAPAPKLKAPPVPTLLRVHQVANRLNVSTSTIYLWCDHGHLEKVKLTDGCVRITESSVDIFVKSGMFRGAYE